MYLNVEGSKGAEPMNLPPADGVMSLPKPRLTPSKRVDWPLVCHSSGRIGCAMVWS